MSESMAEGWRNGAAKALERQYAALVASGVRRGMSDMKDTRRKFGDPRRPGTVAPRRILGRHNPARRTTKLERINE